ncbi:hypothetical protein GQ600_25490 [Phytophthora cactorum]|nr:hypothetical protein GQ600_25490 [Phytophthora cactorum]
MGHAAASELPESGTEAPESGSTSSMGVSVQMLGTMGAVSLPSTVGVFESWDVLEAYLRTYSRRTFQVRPYEQTVSQSETVHGAKSVIES